VGRKNEYSGEGWRLARKNWGGQARPTQTETEQSRLSTSIETLASQDPIRQVVFEEGEGEIGPEGGDGVG
jgi:hypothetical protein